MKILSLKNVDGEWSWTEVDEMGAKNFRTDVDSRGMWERTTDGWKQLKGTLDFKLPKTWQGAYGKIRRLRTYQEK
jgi:hypothetical protein